jgi:hypothetical protein
MTQLALTAFPDWTTIRPVFDWDGSLRDIVIHDCDAADWQRALTEEGDHAAVLLTVRPNP